MRSPEPLGPATTPGPGAVVPPRHPDAVRPGRPIPSHYRHCFGCGQQHPTGLHVQAVAAEGLALTASFEVMPHHQGAPGLAHGGLLAAAVDETLGALNWLLMRAAVTARLETDFVRPVPVGSVLELSARVTGQEGRKVFTAALGRLGPDGPVAVRASALFVQVEAGHFQRHGRPAEVARALSDGDTGPNAEMNP